MWRCFNLGEANEDPGGSWLYAMRYSADDLKQHQEAVIAKMQRMGVLILELADGTLGMGTNHELSDDDMNRFMILIEELTVTNEALEHACIDLHGKTTVNLADIYKTSFAGALAVGNKTSAAGMLRIEIPQLVSDLTRAQFDNEPLVDRDYQAIVDLGNFAAQRIGMLMNGDAIITVSNFAPPQTLTGNDLPQF